VGSEEGGAPTHVRTYSVRYSCARRVAPDRRHLTGGPHSARKSEVVTTREDGAGDFNWYVDLMKRLIAHRGTCTHALAHCCQTGDKKCPRNAALQTRQAS
jgi:hypothetical protein